MINTKDECDSKRFLKAGSKKMEGTYDRATPVSIVFQFSFSH